MSQGQYNVLETVGLRKPPEHDTPHIYIKKFCTDGRSPRMFSLLESHRDVSEPITCLHFKERRGFPLAAFVGHWSVGILLYKRTPSY